MDTSPKTETGPNSTTVWRTRPWLKKRCDEKSGCQSRSGHRVEQVETSTALGRQESQTEVRSSLAGEERRETCSLRIPHGLRPCETPRAFRTFPTLAEGSMTQSSRSMEHHLRTWQQQDSTSRPPGMTGEPLQYQPARKCTSSHNHDGQGMNAYK